MFKVLCAVLPLVAGVAVATPTTPATPATLSKRCDDPAAHPSPLTEPLGGVPSINIPPDHLPVELGPVGIDPFDPAPIELEPIDLDPFDAVDSELGISDLLLPLSPSLPSEPSTEPIDLQPPASSSPTSPLDFPKLPKLNETDEDGRARKGFSNYSRSKNVVYFTDWSIYGAGFLPQNLPADEITHLLYAFAGISYDGSVVPFDPWADEQKNLGKRDDVHGAVEQVFLLKKQHRHMKTLLSIGGWTASQEGKFAPALGTADGRRRFAETAVKLLADWGFDGLDVDYEYPATSEDAQNFVELLRECRAALDEYADRNGQDYHYLLTVATPAGPDHYNVLDMEAMDQYIDSWHLMAYDYAGSWDNVSGQQSNVYTDWENPDSTKFSTEKAVDDYLARGIDPRKIILGLPLYGRSFMNTEGLGQPYSGMGKGSVEPGVWLYRDLPLPGSTVYINKYTISAWTYDESTKELVSYDNVETARLKAEYLESRGLGGAVFWEAAGDRSGDESLIRTLAREMGKLDNSRNMLNYPESRYSNIQGGSW